MSDRERLLQAIIILIAALRMVKASAGLSVTQTQMIDSAINIAHENVGYATPDAA